MKSAIVPYTNNTSTVAIKPQQSMAIVPVKKESVNKESVNKAEITAKDIRKNVLMLLRKRQQRDRLEEKFAKLEQSSKEKESIKNEESKQEKKSSFLGKLSGGLKSKTDKVTSSLLDTIGSLLGIVALDWISKPQNQALLVGIVEGVRQIFRFVDFWVTGSVDNLLSGFANLVGGDTLLERVLGFFQLTAGFFGLKYFLKPQSIITDLLKIRKAIKEGAIRKFKIFLKKTQKFGLKKGLKFAFPRLSKLIGKIGGLSAKILGGIKSILGKTGVGNLFTKIVNAIWRVGKKLPVEKILGPIKQLIRPVSKFLKKIPVVGGLISFGLNLLLGDSLTQAAFKALGAGLGTWVGGGVGTLIPIPVLGTLAGSFIGSMIGEWLGNRFYEMLIKRKPREATQSELAKSRILKAELALKNKLGDSGYDNLSDSQREKKLAKELKISVEKLRELKGIAKKDAEKNKEKDTDVSTSTGDDSASGTAGAKLGIGDGEYGEAPLKSAAKAAGIKGKELAAFLAQMSHESGQFKYKTEISGGKDSYDGGKRYKGRGYIQLTHKYNYKYYGDKLGLDLVNKPELAEAGETAAKIALLYWTENVRPTVGGDWDNVFLHSKAINYPAARSPSDVNGMTDRQAKYDAYIKKLDLDEKAAGGISSASQGGPIANPELRGEGDSKPNVSSIPSLPSRGPSVASIPKQPGSSRPSIMKEISMIAIQNRKFVRRKSNRTTIIKSGDQTYARYTSVAVLPRLNSNTQMSHKRGL